MTVMPWRLDPIKLRVAACMGRTTVAIGEEWAAPLNRPYFPSNDGQFRIRYSFSASGAAPPMDSRTSRRLPSPLMA